MTITSTGKSVSPRQKRAKLKGETTVENENNHGQSSNTDQIDQANNIPVQLESPGKLEIRDKIAVSGIRPISASNLEVVETVNIMGVRPIAANTIEVVDTMNLSGVRPIASSSLVISETYSVMGNRPIASNDIDDSEFLMAFLD